MSEPKFVYVTYIATTPEKLWQALTDGAFTRRFWFGTTVESDWAVGSRVIFRSDGEVHDSGEVLEYVPYRRLSYTWQVEFHEVFRRERPSRVTFELEPTGGAEVKLTVTHDEFEPGSKVHAAVSNGWPMMLSSLKSLLETGHASASTERRTGARRRASVRSRSPRATPVSEDAEMSEPKFVPEHGLCHLHREHAREGLGGADQRGVHPPIFLRAQHRGRAEARRQLHPARARRQRPHAGAA